MTFINSWAYTQLHPLPHSHTQKKLSGLTTLSYLSFKVFKFEGGEEAETPKVKCHDRRNLREIRVHAFQNIYTFL